MSHHVYRYAITNNWTVSQDCASIDLKRDVDYLCLHVYACKRQNSHVLVIIVVKYTFKHFSTAFN